MSSDIIHFPKPNCSIMIFLVSSCIIITYYSTNIYLSLFPNVLLLPFLYYILHRFIKRLMIWIHLYPPCFSKLYNLVVISSSVSSSIIFYFS